MAFDFSTDIPLDSDGTADPAHSRTGEAALRKEDARLLAGRGRYIADVVRPGEVRAAFVRSIHAAARIRGIDVAAARAAPGVIAVLTGVELAADGVCGIPWEVRPPRPHGSPPDRTPLGDPSVARPQPAIATDRVRYAGEIVAMVIAESDSQAKDAAELVVVDYEPLPAVIATPDAVAPDAVQVWEEFPGNLCFSLEEGDAQAVDDAFARSAHVARLDIVNQRIFAHPIETRGYIGEWDARTGRYTLYAAAGKPHPVRNTLADDIFRLPRDRVRVVSPDIGGGFGAKNVVYPEECLVLWAARRIGRPVKWIQERIEAALSDTQARDQVTHAELALDADGGFLALRVDTIANLGGYLAPRGVNPPGHHRHLLANVYAFPALRYRVRAVYTNTVPTCSTRGAGGPEAIFIVERLIDQAARAMGIDPAALRLRNLIPESAMPYTTVQHQKYDSGQFEANMRRAMAIAGWSDFAARRSDAAARGRLRGIGIANAIETHGFGISESADVRVEADGRVAILIGTKSSGQGHATVYAQIAAEAFGIGLDHIVVLQGDTDIIAEGSGTGASRSLIVGGSAVLGAAQTIVEKGRRIAAHLLEASETDVEFAEGRYRIVGTDRSVAFGAVAQAAQDPSRLPPGVEPGLAATLRFDPTAATFPNGCHVAEVEVDPETGTVALVGYAMVQDAGRIVNPPIVAGQLHGGVAYGVGQALMERTVYDADGQMLSATFMDYAMPRASDLPSFVYEANEVPCRTNPLGVKACGETGPVAAPPAVINALLDALAPVGVTDIEMPATPLRVWRAIRVAGTGRR